MALLAKLKLLRKQSYENQTRFDSLKIAFIYITFISPRF